MFKFFNPPLINLSITQTYQKSCNLNFAKVKDLVEALVDFSKAQPETNPQIRRKISSQMELHIFRDAQCITIQLFSNDTDHAQVKMDFSELGAIFQLLKSHISNYYSLCKDLLINVINSEVRESISQIPLLIKGIPNQIVSSDNLDRRADAPAVEVEAKAEHSTTTKITDVNSFFTFSLILHLL